MNRFDALVRQILSVPHEEIMRHEAEYKRQSAMNPHRRGPKPKVTDGVVKHIYTVSFLSDSTNGAVATPRSVMMAVT